ncbi:hypothetical protein INS49_014059 [Diaporthe citri]|uniref:uncharacterized protein n=1 Tax=Diaporthe citri TaxID=83186 RepID=UPI001C826E08|nr:uncharacterized protein INS49_014059 [Diaporthe citri]KAG6358175.1 hypothetical protein INS49_014059 [Diaporthe citri]
MLYVSETWQPADGAVGAVGAVVAFGAVLAVFAVMAVGAIFDIFAVGGLLELPSAVNSNALPWSLLRPLLL